MATLLACCDRTTLIGHICGVINMHPPPTPLPDTCPSPTTYTNTPWLGVLHFVMQRPCIMRANYTNA